jgi:hypothetical protein
MLLRKGFAHGGSLSGLRTIRLHSISGFFVHSEELLLSITAIAILFIEFEIVPSVRVYPTRPTRETTARMTTAR